MYHDSMLIFVRIMGCLMMGFGGYLIVRPQYFNSILEFFKVTYRIYIIATLQMIIGLLFIYASPIVRYENVILWIGVLIMVSGISIYLMGSDKTRRIIAWYQKQTLLTKRGFATFTFLLGVFVLISA